MIPICCITYNRIKSLERLLKSLDTAIYDEEVTLIISIDKSDSDEIEKYADRYLWTHGKKIVLKHEKNLGLRKHILSCGELLKEYEAMIVLEDDITVATSFYKYAKQCVEAFSKDMQCAGISLYGFQRNYQNRLPFIPLRTDSDVYKMSCAQSWGQVWMRKQWFDFMKWYNDNSGEFEESPLLPRTICKWPKSSWLKYHTRYCIEKNKYFIYPYVSLSTNNGDIGVHASKKFSFFQTQLQFGEKKKFLLNPKISYDGFFENLQLCTYMDIDKDNICIDLYGEKCNREKKRYWLTRKRENFKIISSYALELIPWEMNIIERREGTEIFLYDTNYPQQLQSYRDSDIVSYFYYIPNNLLKSFIKKRIINYIKRVFRLRWF